MEAQTSRPYFRSLEKGEPGATRSSMPCSLVSTQAQRKVGSHDALHILQHTITSLNKEEDSNCLFQVALTTNYCGYYVYMSPISEICFKALTISADCLELMHYSRMPYFGVVLTPLAANISPLPLLPHSGCLHRLRGGGLHGDACETP